MAREIFLRTGPFTIRLDSCGSRRLEAGLRLLYDEAWFLPSSEFSDFHITLARGSLARRWIRPQIIFDIDGERPFKPLPAAQALASFEWGLNYAIAMNAHHYLILHAAVVEKNGVGVILPGISGTGKSTLTAALAYRGWRLLSDELALIRLRDGLVDSLARPINLKNDSIELMRRFAPEAVSSETVTDTIKGSVALFQAPPESRRRVAEPARIRQIVFPRWQSGASPKLSPYPKARAVIAMGDQSYNYSIHGRASFALLSSILEQSDCHEFVYGNLDDAVRTFDGLS